MILSKLLDIAVKNTLKQYFSPEENGVLISYMVIEKSQFLIWGVYYSPPCIWGDLKICHPNFQFFVHFWSDILKKDRQIWFENGKFQRKFF